MACCVVYTDRRNVLMKGSQKSEFNAYTHVQIYTIYDMYYVQCLHYYIQGVVECHEL